ncbi:MAG: right-handed parallel beta-helix repeat-containing protein [Bacteroidota bacterium]|nr:right-handed parallel beta-helix repeat-containing protein [Bacteroidota bacterium]
MKKLLTILFICLLQNCFAQTTYYISNEGSTSNSGTSTSTTWPLSKVNSFSFSAGDNVYFKSGETFYGNIVVNSSGVAGNPIYYGAYGSGSNPIITGFSSVTTWTNRGSNIWESSIPISNLSNCHMVSINGVNTPMGRYPNGNTWFPYQSHSGYTSITSSSLGGTDWRGAQAVVRVLRWGMDIDSITSTSGSTITFTTLDNNTGYGPQDGYGFFIQNDLRTLDVQNEWYYNPTTRKIDIYSTSSPLNVNVSTIDTLVYSNNESYVTFSNLSFQGANQFCIKINNSNGEPYGSNFIIKNCDFNYAGLSGIDVYASTYLNINNNTFNNCNNFAINAGGAGSTNAIITNNLIKNSGVIPGAGSAFLGGYKGIHAVGANGNISYNEIDSTGFNALEFDGDNTVVQNNFINNYCFVLDDGGGIYTFPNILVAELQRNVSNNIILNSGDAHAGTADNTTQAMGIYLDGLSSNVNVIGNSISKADQGIFINNSSNINIISNTVFNTGQAIYLRKYNSGVAMPNVYVHKNIFFAQAATQRTQEWYFEPGNTVTLPSGYSSDSNYYARPIDDNLTIRYQGVNKNLATWQGLSGQDAHSNKSPRTITDVAQLDFEYNPTSSPVTKSLSGIFVDVTNTSYSGSITLQPYTSAGLIYTGALSTNFSISRVPYFRINH